MPFPPYQLLDNDHVLAAQDKFARLERLYHHAQTQSWDGKQVLRELLDRHGGIRISDDKREAIGQLFHSVAAARVEPVLSDLMPYYARDEARHVGLGVIYLPELLRKSGPLERARLQLLQLKIVTFIGWGTHIKRPYFESLGIDNNV